MFDSLPARAFSGLVVLALSVATLTACSTPPVDSAYPDMTLAETKSPVQLLRNEAAGRIPAELISEVVAARDQSTSCQMASDPEGRIRSWGSSVRVSLTDAAGKDVESIVDDLVASFEEQGWEAGIYGVSSIVDLTSKDSIVAIHISPVAGDEETGAGAKVQLTVSGPCVVTDGAESDEVLDLERREE
jgi:hypothetical protein